MSREVLPIDNQRLERTGLSWEKFEKINKSEIYGMAIFDLDGTVTVPGSKYAVDKRTLSDISEFVFRGGICCLNTGATKERSERTFMHPVFCRLDEISGFEEASKIFAQRVWLLPENGSSILKAKEVKVIENELWFSWDEHNSLHVPNKESLRQLIEDKLVPTIEGSFVIGDRPGEIGRRNYILSWKGLRNVPELIQMIRNEVIPNSPEIDWSQIDMKGARTTIDFINVKSGKEPSTRKLLEMMDFDGPIVGFGDLGDEFGKVLKVLTFNVNEKNPNSFRTAQVPSLETYRWVEIDAGDCSVNSKGEVFFRGEKIEVVRNRKGEIIYGKSNENGHFSPNQSKEQLLAALPLTRGAGEATAEILERLVEVGYFDKEC